MTKLAAIISCEKSILLCINHIQRILVAFILFKVYNYSQSFTNQLVQLEVTVVSGLMRHYLVATLLTDLHVWHRKIPALEPRSELVSAPPSLSSAESSRS